MKCADCGAENTQESFYCATCGGPLYVDCDACAFNNSTRARFCGGCGQPLPAGSRTEALTREAPSPLAQNILSSRRGLEGERKQITVLFADLCRSLELIEGSDPELARELLDKAVQIMMDAVHRFEGTVNRIMGDGIMSLFGAPLAQEGHAVRACYAALAMTDSIEEWNRGGHPLDGLDLRIRVGINTGEVIVRAMHSDLSIHYDAIGTAPHLANRMEELATPGTIRLTQETARLVTGYVDLRSLGAMPVKGMREAVEVYELCRSTDTRTPFQVTLARGLTRFVGRRPELETLEQALKFAGSGFGQVIAVVGEPGIGKSRLCFEFLSGLRGEDWQVMKTAAASYGRTTPWLPVINLLRDCFQIKANDDTPAIADKVTSRLNGLDERLSTLLVPLLACLDQPIDDDDWRALTPAQRRQQMLKAAKALLFATSRARPLVILFEDVHGCDHESQALLDALVEGMRAVRLLLIVTYRPDFRHTWGGKSYYGQCSLEPLAEGSALELLDTVLGRDPSLDPLKRELVERTEGNPFFLEESVRDLVERGALIGSLGAYRMARLPQSLQVPATVQSTLAARVDRLIAADKDLLLAASVIGRRVDIELLQVVTGVAEHAFKAGLARLCASEFLDEADHFPLTEYVFRHALTQEVAYANVLHDQRRLLSRRIVAALESGRSKEEAGWHERLALHAFRGELWEKSATHYRVLGDRALERSANAEAANAYGRALAALGHLSADQDFARQAIDVRLDLANALFAFGEPNRVLEVVREAQHLAEQNGDRHRIARTHSAMTLYHWMMGNPVRAIESGRQARKVAHDQGDFDLQVLTALRLAVALQAHGDYQDTVELFGWAVDAIKGDDVSLHFGLTSIAAVAARTSLARSFAELGRFEAGVDMAEEGVRLASSLRHPFSQVYAAREVGLFYIRRGQLERAIELLEEGVRLCKATSNQVLYPVSEATLGYALALAGKIDDGIRLLEAAAEHSLAMDLMVRLSLQLSWLGEAYLLAGRNTEAVAQGIRALELARRYDERGHLGWAHRMLGDAYRSSRPAAVAESERHYRKALEIADDLQMRVLQAHCRLGLGLLYRATEDGANARKELLASMQLFREMGMANWLQRVETLAGPTGRSAERAGAKPR